LLTINILNLQSDPIGAKASSFIYGAFINPSESQGIVPTAMSLGKRKLWPALVDKLDLLLVPKDSCQKTVQEAGLE
jgi:hypothetical protein